MHYNAFAAKGIIRSPITSCSTRDHSVVAAVAENAIGREGGDGSAQRRRSVIYDCLVLSMFMYVFYVCVVICFTRSSVLLLLPQLLLLLLLYL